MHYIDLFAGAGGLSEGFIRAGLEPVVHIEKDRSACMTLRTRVAYHYLKKHDKEDRYRKYLHGDIDRDTLYSYIPDELLHSVINEEITDESIDDLFSSIDSRMEKKAVSKINVIVGGPPCQAYSLVGRARDPQNMRNDPRNHLYNLYIRFLERYQPDMFVFENVPGILSVAKGELFQNIRMRMENAGYAIEPRLIDASKYGVLQKRKRIILVGWKRGTGYSYPSIKQNDVEETEYRVWDILKDLPPLKPGQEIRTGSYIREPSEYLVNNGIRRESDILTQHYARPHNERDREIYKRVIEVWDREKRILKYPELPDRLRTHKNLKSFLDRFKVVPGDLPYSHTVVAHISKDGHYYIHPDKKQLRSLSTREAARIQSFPDNYYFEGSRSAIYRQIGNAVPPLLAETIARAIRDMLESIR